MNDDHSWEVCPPESRADVWESLPSFATFRFSYLKSRSLVFAGNKERPQREILPEGGLLGSVIAYWTPVSQGQLYEKGRGGFSPLLAHCGVGTPASCPALSRQIFAVMEPEVEFQHQRQKGPVVSEVRAH